MKKRFIKFTAFCAICAVLLCSAAAAAFAEEGTTAESVAEYTYDESLPRVVDNADLLSDEEESSLENECRRIIAEYGIDAVILTADGIGDYTAQEYADDYYDYTGYGVGEYKDGVLLLISMADRQWHISTTGKCINMIDVSYLSDGFLSYISDGDYADGFLAFLRGVDEAAVLSAISGGADFSDDDYDDYYGDYGDSQASEPQDSKFDIRNFLVCFAAAAVISAVIVYFISRKMKSMSLEKDSDRYAVGGGIQLTESRDVFLFSNIKKHKKPEQTNTSSRGGSGGFHTGSSGRSHGGGGGHF